MFPTDDADLAALARLAIRAGGEILAVAATGIEVATKQDASPVTLADQRAEAVILEGLAAIFPKVAIVAEEEAAAGRLPSDLGRCFLLVDPLDGTREFISGNGEYTVNVALVEDGRPNLGVVHSPALKEIHVGRVGVGAAKGVIADDGTIAWTSICTREGDIDAPAVLASRSHAGAETEALLARLPGASRIAAGSSLKFCRVAEGAADIYPRLGRTMQWDIAAGEAVLVAAGGRVVGLDGCPLVYGAGDGAFANAHFIAAGSEAMLDLALHAVGCGANSFHQSPGVK